MSKQVMLECPYCGQMNTTVIGGSIEDFTEEELAHLGKSACGCCEAQAYQAQCRAQIDADAAVDEIFYEETENFRSLIHEAVKCVAHYTVSKVTMVNEEGIKAVVTRKGNNVRVERIESLKKSIEGSKREGFSEVEE